MENDSRNAVSQRVGADVVSALSRGVFIPAARFLSNWGAVLIVACAVATVCFGVWGFALQNADPDQPAARGSWQIVYAAVQLLFLESGGDGPDNGALIVARLLAITTVALAAGAVLTTLLRNSFSSFRLALSWNQSVICGAGRIGVQLVEDLCQGGPARRVVVIEADERNVQLNRCRQLGAVVLVGDATDPEMLRRSGVQRADQIFAVAGQDSTNLEIALGVGKQLARSAARRSSAQRRRPRCYLHLLDLQLARLFQDHSKGQPANAALDVRVFNAFANAALALVVDELASIAHRPAPDQVAHYVLFGFGQLGQSVALAIAQHAHFDNLRQSRMTIVYDDEQEKKGFLKRFGQFAPEGLNVEVMRDCHDQWQDNALRPAERHQVKGDGRAAKTPIEYVCNAEFVSFPQQWQDVENEEFAERLLKRFEDRIAPRVIVCYDDDRKNLDGAVRLRGKLLRVARRCGLPGAERIPVFVGLPIQPGLSELLAAAGPSREESTPATDNEELTRRLIPFGRCDRSCNLQQITRPETEALAIAMHNRYREQQVARRGADAEPLALPESAQQWSALSEEFRASNRLAAAHAMVTLRRFGNYRVHHARNPRHANNGSRGGSSVRVTRDDGQPLSDDELACLGKRWHDEIELLAQIAHNRFVAERLLAGWQYAENTDRQKQVNSTLVPWAELDQEFQDHDREQVREAAKVLGLKLAPQPQS